MGDYQTSHAVGCAFGYDAILLALRSLGIAPGDEVLLLYSFFATAHPPCERGARWGSGSAIG